MFWAQDSLQQKISLWLLSIYSFSTGFEWIPSKAMSTILSSKEHWILSIPPGVKPCPATTWVCRYARKCWWDMAAIWLSEQFHLREGSGLCGVLTLQAAFSSSWSLEESNVIIRTWIWMLWIDGGSCESLLRFMLPPVTVDVLHCLISWHSRWSRREHL